ncbi:MAG: hypothetical protein HOO98_05785 [Nitrospira sp.]|nr:hypothetical protein [Nitrospira sp.]
MLRHLDTIVLQAWNGKFISVASGVTARLHAQRNRFENIRQLGSPAQFTVERLVGRGLVEFSDLVVLRAFNGKYVGAYGGRGGSLDANHTRESPRVNFRIEVSRPQLVRLQSSSDRYLTAESKGRGRVSTNRTAVSLGQTFSLLNLSQKDRTIPHTIRRGDVIALQSYNNKFLRVDPGVGQVRVSGDLCQWGSH